MTGSRACGLAVMLTASTLAAMPPNEDFSNDPGSRWTRIDGKYWSITQKGD